MADSAVLSVRLDRDVKERFEKVAKDMQRSQSFLAATAIEDFVRLQEQQIAGIHEAIVAADRGEFIAHDDVQDWIDALGTSTEKPIPTSK